MLLVVDFSELDFEIDRTDVRLNSNDDFTVGKLLKKLCDGIEEIGKIKIPNKNNLMLLSPNHNKLNLTSKINDLKLNDWDTIYISKGG
jgi:hypothetical protein